MPPQGRTARLAVIAALALSLVACDASANPPAAAPRPQAVAVPDKFSQIRHVVIVVQENRSVDNLFQGFPGANTRSYGFDKNGNKIALEPVLLEARWDMYHDANAFFHACDGQGSLPGTQCRMDGFDEETWRCGHPDEPRCPNANPPYSYVPRYETQPYFTIGQSYIFADQMFPSNFDSSSFVSHQYIISAKASSTVNYPVGSWGCAGTSSVPTVTQQRTIGASISPCLDNLTLGDEMDKARVSWRFYTSEVGGNGGSWSAYQAIKHIYEGPDWNKNVVTPQTKFFGDVRNGALPEVSWITPTCANSDHPGCVSNTGPDWVANIVNAIGESPYWDSTAIFIFWDDYGGWYDHVAPALVDYDGLGIRVPLLIVSAYARKGCVSHVRYEHGSILKFVEDRWHLARLSASDTRANGISAKCFNFTKPPRAFVPIPVKHALNFYLEQPPDLRPPDPE